MLHTKSSSDPLQGSNNVNSIASSDDGWCSFSPYHVALGLITYNSKVHI